MIQEVAANEIYNNVRNWSHFAVFAEFYVYHRIIKESLKAKTRLPTYVGLFHT